MAVDTNTIVERNKRFVTPKGIAEPYAYLNRPDYGQGHFANDRGKHKVSLTYPVSDPEVQKLMGFLEGLYAKTYEVYLEDHKKNPPAVQRGKKPLEPYQGNLPFVENGDGTVTFRFDAWASYVDPKTKQTKPINLTYADAQGRPIANSNVPNIFGGSELRVSYKVVPYGWSNIAGASIKLQLQGVQLIKVVESSNDASNDFADFAEEGGYEAPAGSEFAQHGEEDEEEEQPPFNTGKGDDDDDEGLHAPQGGDF